MTIRAAWMRWLRGTALALLVAAVGGAGAVGADEPAPVPGAPPAPAAVAGESLLERGLAALKLRIEAKLKEAELLEKADKVDEALAAVRDVERLYREGIDDLTRLMDAARAAAALGPVVIRPRIKPDVPEHDDPFADGIGREPGLTSPGQPLPGLPGREGAPAEPRMLSEAVRRRLEAAERGLAWLAAHQSPDGGWEAAGFERWCHGKPNTGERPDGQGKAMYDTGVTGLALCAFLGAGYTSRSDHAYARVVRDGLAYLKNAQDPEGCFGPRSTLHYVYNHACASLAVIEAYGMTGSPILKGSAQKALDFIALSRNPYFVWRYGVKPGDNDTSVTGWMTMALESARRINEDADRRGTARPLVLDEEAFDGVRAWLDKMTDPDYGRVGYIQRGQGPARPQELVDQFPSEKSESMTAVGMLARILMREDPKRSALIRKGADLCMTLLPTWNLHDGSIDMYYWFFGSLAMHPVGGEPWGKWERALDQAVVRTQRRDGEECGFKGSWDPVDPWGPDGGRVYSTALMTLSCEVAFRDERYSPPR